MFVGGADQWVEQGLTTLFGRATLSVVLSSLQTLAIYTPRFQAKRAQVLHGRQLPPVARIVLCRPGRFLCRPSFCNCLFTCQLLRSSGVNVGSPWAFILAAATLFRRVTRAQVKLQFEACQPCLQPDVFKLYPILSYPIPPPVQASTWSQGCY